MRCQVEGSTRVSLLERRVFPMEFSRAGGASLISMAMSGLGQPLKTDGAYMFVYITDGDGWTAHPNFTRREICTVNARRLAENLRATKMFSRRRQRGRLRGILFRKMRKNFSSAPPAHGACDVA